MKRLISIATAALLLATFAAGCTDGARVDEVTPDIVSASATITKAELIEGLWDDDAEIEASQDVECVIGSTFTIKSDNPFTISQNFDPSDYNTADVIVISPVNIVFEDSTSDGRGAACGEGMLEYVVQASEAAPIDIEVAEALRSRHSLVHMASGSHTEYPGCTIMAHFDKSGEEICDSGLTGDDDEDDSLIHDIGVIDDDDEKVPIAVKPIPGVIGDLEIKAVTLSDDGVPCSDQDIHSIKMVVDDYNCQLEGFSH